MGISSAHLLWDFCEIERAEAVEGAGFCMQKQVGDSVLYHSLLGWQASNRFWGSLSQNGDFR
jgi:hypothetical protein